MESLTVKSLALTMVLAMVVAQPQGAGAAGRATSYVNARFGYSIDYPADFLSPEREADNGDGRAFHARHGAGKVLVWGSYRDEDSEATPAAIAQLNESDCAPGKITYEVAKPKLVAFSCMSRAGGIIYQKTLVGRDVLRSVRFDYPDSERAAWEPVVKQVAGSLRTGSK